MQAWRDICWRSSSLLRIPPIAARVSWEIRLCIQRSCFAGQAEAFLPQFQAFDRLHKAATIVTRFKLTLAQLKWLMDRSAAPGWLDLNQLPVRVASGQPQQPRLLACCA